MNVKRARNAIKTIGSIVSSSWSTRSVTVGYYLYDNFGDLLTPDILEYFGVRPFHCPNFRYAKAIGVGSLLHKVPDNYAGYFLGSGMIAAERRKIPNAIPLLVRGRLTKELLNCSSDTLVGDPGLIVDLVYSKFVAKEKIWDIGVVPHYSDLENDFVKRVLNDTSKLEALMIDVRKSPSEVVREISQCKMIVSSSLHGLIVSDSLGIPSCWLKVSDKILGGDFKFRDYYSCFGLDKRPIIPNEKYGLEQFLDKGQVTPTDSAMAIKHDIRLAYKTFARSVVDR